jgi:alpha-L-fucosidase 2
MKKMNIAIWIIITLAATGCSKSKMSNQDYVARYKAVFTRPAQKVPTPLVPDGPVAGNGDVGIVVGGKPEFQTIYISKVDFWKAKRGYPEGGVCLPGGLNVSIPELEGSSFYAEQLIADGTIIEEFKKDDLTFHLSTFVPSGNNSVIMEMYTEGKRDCHVTLDLWAKTGLESNNKSGDSGDIYWVSRSFDSTDLDWPTHIVLAMRTIGATGRNFALKPSEKVYVVISACTNHESPDYAQTAFQNARQASVKSIKTLQKDNNAWWKNFWDESLVEIGDTTVEKYYYGSQYLLASCSRNKNFPPGLWGNTLTMDATFEAWEGDYHSNYNHEAPWWGSYSSNHIALTEVYDQPILDYIPEGRKHARQFLNADGVYYPLGIGPKGFCTSMYPLTSEKMMKYYHVPDTNIEGGYMFGGQRNNGAFLTANMFMRFYSTYDTAYARKVYPYLKEIANFWEGFLHYEDGRYVVRNDNHAELGAWWGNRPWRRYLKSEDINPSMTLGMLRMFFKGMKDVCGFLNIDNDNQGKWSDILTKLSPIPTDEKDGIIRIKYCEGGNSWGIEQKPGLDGWQMSWGLVYPSGSSGIYTDSVFARIIRGEVSRWDWKNPSITIISGLHTANRVGYDPTFIYNKMNETIRNLALPNLWIAHGGGGVETLASIPSLINEMLLQSYEGLIRVFPNWLPGKDAKFSTLRAYGAFLISSEKKNNEVTYVEIISEKGRDCIILNPWNSGKVEITTEGPGKIAFDEKDNRIIFKTEAGKKYLLKQI